MNNPDRARRRRLLEEIRRIGGRITTGQAHHFYRATGWGPCRTTARRGVLTEHGPAHGRFYLLTPGGNHA